MPEINVQELTKKWSKVLEHETVDPIKNQKIKTATAIMLENQLTYLNEGRAVRMDESSDMEGTLGRSGSYSTNGDFYKIALPMVRRTFPELIAHEIVGVQPMNAPVGLAFAIRFRSGSTGSTYVDGTEVGYNTIETDFSRNGTTSTDTSAAEALGSKAGSGVGNDFGIGKGSGTHIRELQMTLEKAQVEATTRKLRSRWSQEVAQDLKAMHGLNIESEMMDLLRDRKSVV